MPKDINVTGVGLKRQNQNKKTEGRKAYTIADGESYFSISARQLGNGATQSQIAAYARALAAANNNMSLRSGQTIKIPRVTVAANARLFTQDGTLGGTPPVSPPGVVPAGSSPPGFGANMPNNAPLVAPGYGAQSGLTSVGLGAYQNSERGSGTLNSAVAGVIGQGADPFWQRKPTFSLPAISLGGNANNTQNPNLPQVTLTAPSVIQPPGSPDKATFANPSAGQQSPTVRAGTTANTASRNADEQLARTGNLYLNNIADTRFASSYDIAVLDEIGVDIPLLLQAGYQPDLNTGRLVISPQDLTALQAAANSNAPTGSVSGVGALMDNGTFFNSTFTGIRPFGGRSGSNNVPQYADPNSGGYPDYGSALSYVVNWRVSFG